MVQMENIHFFGGLASLVLAFIAMVLSYGVFRLYRYHRASIGWFAITISLSIIMLRRLIEEFAIIGNQPALYALFTDYEWMFLVGTSLVQIYAFLRIKKSFEEEKRVEEETMERIRRFEAKKREFFEAPLKGRKKARDSQ